MGDVPLALRRNGRPIDPEFLPTEELYFRVQAGQIHGQHVLPGSVRMPAQSVDRQKYCPNPEWVLLPDYSEWGIAAFLRQDVPNSITSAGNVTYRFVVEHHPLEDNYSHSEIRSFRNEEVVFNPKLDVNQAVRKLFKMRLTEAMRIIGLPKA